MPDGYSWMMRPLWLAQATARSRSPEKMQAFVHRSFYFDSGMSFFCKVCGERSQSMQPSGESNHRAGCPLKAIADKFDNTEWPDRDGDDVSWDMDLSPICETCAVPKSLHGGDAVEFDGDVCDTFKAPDSDVLGS